MSNMRGELSLQDKKELLSRFALFTDDTDGRKRNNRVILRFLRLMRYDKPPKLTRADYVLFKRRRQARPKFIFRKREPAEDLLAKAV